jgi:hypothetical protein
MINWPMGSIVVVPQLHVDEGIAVFNTDSRHQARGLGRTDRQIVGDAGLVVDVGADQVAAQRSERRENLADGIGERAAPFDLGGQARVVAGDAAQQAVRRRFPGGVCGLRQDPASGAVG